MSWYKRLKEDEHVHAPRECPDYSEIEYFTIKFHHGGEMTENPRSYVGVKLIILIITNMERACFVLDSDEEVMLMYELMPKERYVNIFVKFEAPLSSSQNLEFREPIPPEHDEIDLNDPDSDEDYEIREKESSDETFHSDSSNIDESDDDLIFEQNVDDIYYDKVDSASDGNSSVYANSEDERMVADYYETELRMNPTWPVNAFHRKIVNDLKFDVSKHTVYRAKRRALMKISGTHEEQYTRVWKYAHEVKKVLPSSTIKILTENPEPETDRGRFMRFYVCLGPLKEAFSQHCRRIIGLDGCHLKGPYGGQFLAAVGVDANDGMYPIAWTIVNDPWEIHVSDHYKKPQYMKKSDEIKKAAEEGREPNIAKTTVSCKTCKKTGHNSWTCSAKKTTNLVNTATAANDRVEAPVQKLKTRKMTRQQGQNDGAEGSKRDEVTTLRQLEAAKRKKVGKKDNMAAKPGWRI
ncbi:hypothetical protein AgCh_001359 [Apium graveolens]